MFLNKLKLTIFFLLLCTFYGNSQIFKCKDGITKFTSEAPLEMIKAQNNKTTGAIDFATKNVAFMVTISDFNGFNGGLQKEHFLENYLESEKFPKSTFSGKIIEDIELKNGTYSVRAKGKFNIHGVEKEKIIKVKIIIKDKVIDVESDFDVPLDEYNIKVPKIVNQKIASVIAVQVKATLKTQ